MADVVDAATRSRMMSGIKGKDTKPEIAIRLGLHAAGFRYRLHANAVPGRPDLWLPKYQAAIFIHGCFWHGHDCSLFKMPGTRQEFWLRKIESNRARDSRVDKLLLDINVRRLAIWECAIRGPGRLGLKETLKLAAEWLRSNNEWGEIRGGR